MIKIPTQCRLWKEKELLHYGDLQGGVTEQALLRYPDLESGFTRIRMIDDEDLWPGVTRTLEQCKECGQRYFRQYWDNFNETYINLIPVETEDDVATLSATSVPDLAKIAPQLRYGGWRDKGVHQNNIWWHAKDGNQGMHSVS